LDIKQSTESNENPESLDSIEKSEFDDVEFEESTRSILDPSNEDFVDVFVNSFGVNTISPTSPEWYFIKFKRFLKGQKEIHEHR
jgi:hypothetical protein